MQRRFFLRLGILSGLASIACRRPLEVPAGTASLALRSSAFEANGAIPAEHTCSGRDSSPPLSWDAPPAGTASFALICDDPDAPLGTWVHWVLYDLPAQLRTLPAAVPPGETLSGGGFQGRNDFGDIGYGGPCPPRGQHRYFFKLYALDIALDLAAGASKAQVEAAISGHILAVGGTHRALQQTQQPSVAAPSLRPKPLGLATGLLHPARCG